MSYFAEGSAHSPAAWAATKRIFSNEEFREAISLVKPSQAEVVKERFCETLRDVLAEP
jgi:hypothetical protein